MKVSVDVRDLRHTKADLLVVPLTQNDPAERKLGTRLTALDAACGRPLAAALASGDFQGKAGEAMLVYSTAPDAPTPRILLLGLGQEDELNAAGLRRAGGSAVRHGVARKAATVALAVARWRRIQPPAAAQALAEGAMLGSYRFGRHKSKPKKGAAPHDVDTVRLVYDRLPNRAAVRSAAQTGVVVAEGQNLARDLSNEPPNALPPAALAREAQKMAKAAGLKCKVMSPAELERRKMTGILAVGQGSANTPRMIVLEHGAASAGKRGRPTVCLIGKGITFDSGGISIKPSAAMDEMKHDMSGAAAVVGAMQAIARLKVPLHVVGVIAAAENMPSGTAYRPGDVISTLAGKTIEILNTDAEGRVVLADALEYARTTYRPVAMVDLATLTGACMVALGPWATGVFSNHDGFASRMQAAGEACGERAWPMPLLKEHREAMRSTIADLKNAGGRYAGASTAAGFLAEFVGETPWVHLDIAGTGWTQATNSTQPKGATGVGVRLLLELLRGWKNRPPV